MSDLISRSALYDRFAYYESHAIRNTNYIWNTALREIANAPDADVKVDENMVVHAKWVKAQGMMPPEFAGKHKCSRCLHFALSYRYGREELSLYCPNCGAQMDLEDNQ